MHRSGGVGCVDHRVGRGGARPGLGNLKNAADEGAGDLAATHIAGDGDAQGGDIDDGELALEKEAGADANAIDHAGELETGRALESGDGGGEKDVEVAGVVFDVGPLEADGVDLDGQPLGPLEAGAIGTADADGDAEAFGGVGGVTGFEVAVAGDVEVTGGAAEFDGADLNIGGELAEDGERAAAGGASIEVEADGAQLQEAAELHAEGVGLEDEAVDFTVGEGEIDAEGLGVLGAVGVAVVGGVAINDGGGEGAAAGEEFSAAGGEEDGAVKGRDGGTGEVEREVGDADAKVVELKNGADADLLTGGGAGGGIGAGGSGGSGGDGAAVDDLGLAEGEAVAAHDETGDEGVVGVQRLGVVGGDLAGEVDSREDN